MPNSKIQGSLPSVRVPYPDARVEAARCHPLTIKSDGVNVAVVALESVQATALRDAPNLCRRIVAARNQKITLDFQAADARLMADKHILAKTGRDVPYPESRVPGPRYRRGGVGHLEAANG